MQTCHACAATEGLVKDAIRSCAREHPGDRDEAWFMREIVPQLDQFPLRKIAEVTGPSLAACSRIRAGTRVPHPRHWSALLALVSEQNCEVPNQA
jgi:hypothetical protein